MKVSQKVNFSLKEIVNAQSTTNVIKDYVGETLKLTGILIANKEDVDQDTGDIKTTKVVVLKTDKELISSISPTLASSAETIISAYDENGILDDIAKGIDVIISSSESSKGREFFFLTLK